MDFNVILSYVTQFLGTFVLAAGGIAAFSVWLFKLLGTKWLDTKFNERLHNLKAAQDEALKYIQFTIDRDIHRAKKLYDNEFTALSECWRLLRDAFDTSVSTIASWSNQVDRYTDEELDRLLTKRGMEDWEKRHLIEKSGKARLEYYTRWSERERFKDIDKAWREFRTHLDTNSIFFPEGLTEKLRAIEQLISASNVEFKCRLEEMGSLVGQRTGFDARHKLRVDGEVLMKELEGLVRERIWSAAK